MKYTITNPNEPDRYITCRERELQDQLGQGDTAHPGMVKLVDGQPQALSTKESRSRSQEFRPVRRKQLARVLKVIKRAIETGNTARLQALIDRLES